MGRDSPITVTGSRGIRTPLPFSPGARTSGSYSATRVRHPIRCKAHAMPAAEPGQAKSFSSKFDLELGDPVVGQSAGDTCLRPLVLHNGARLATGEIEVET